MRVVLALSLILALNAPAHANPCQGRNLIKALPPADLSALRALAEVPFAKGNLWQAHKDGQEMILVGTYHLADPRFDDILATLDPIS